MPGPFDHPQRAAFAAHSWLIPRLLSRFKDPPVDRQGHTGWTTRSAGRVRNGRFLAQGRRSASSLRTPRGLTTPARIRSIPLCGDVDAVGIRMLLHRFAGTIRRNKHRDDRARGRFQNPLAQNDVRAGEPSRRWEARWNKWKGQVQAFLDMEVAAGKTGPTAGVEGDPLSGPTDVAGEHTVGRTSDPWRAFEAWLFHLPGRRLEIHGPLPIAAIAVVADIPYKSRRLPGVDRFLRGPHGHVPVPPIYSICGRNLGILHHPRTPFPTDIRSSTPPPPPSSANSSLVVRRPTQNFLPSASRELS